MERSVKIGLMFNTDPLSGSEIAAVARRAEQIGIDTVWVPELFGREPFVTASRLLAATDTMRIATGIANVYARDAMATRAAAQTLAEFHDNRFTLGLGVSNTVGNTARGHAWLPPLQKLDRFFRAMEEAPFMRKWENRVPVYLAAHGPKLMAFAAERADGALSYMMTPEYTRRARELLGPDKQMNVVLTCLVCEDRGKALKIARRAVRIYTELPNYRRAWSTLGFEPADFEGGGSDELIDTLVAFGSMADVAARVAEHRLAGADQVVVISLNDTSSLDPDWDMLQTLHNT
ncbi:MAG: TIGR03620 family F420-dependent LLM class oxidoreductase [Gammaproteobacteria bacterium]|nr:MAG: TIGR03620 family F420-dependent LLM class oxidoreductase [Gammaproteobacteria bacterium]